MAVAGIAAAFSVLGTIGSVVGSFVQYNASMKAEELRKNQTKLEAQRARREQVRRTQVDRAKAVASAYNQGAESTSALAGGTAQIQNTGGRNIVAINQDQKISEGIFDANKQSALGGLIANLGSGISSLGGAVASNAGTITRVGSDIPFFKDKKYA